MEKSTSREMKSLEKKRKRRGQSVRFGLNTLVNLTIW